MHEKFAKQDVAVLSVSLDDPREKGKHERVLKFLRDRKATFPNVILDVTQEFWQDKFKIFGPPTVFVFNRDGKFRQFKENVEYADIHKTVEEFLKK